MGGERNAGLETRGPVIRELQLEPGPERPQTEERCGVLLSLSLAVCGPALTLSPEPSSVQSQLTL